MGGGDLNMKKSWHPLLMKNQERVWLEEKKALEEKKKLDQLRKEKEEERQLQELQRLQEDKTGKKRSEKLDWMYATPATGSTQNANDLEDYLLGKKRVDQLLIADENEKVGAAHKNFIATQQANTLRDTAAKVREDPLFAIKQQEQAAYEALMKNPLRLREMQMRNGLAPPKEDKKARKERKRAEKERAKEEKRAGKRRERSGERESERSRTYGRDDEDSYHRRSPSPYDDRRRRSPSPEHRRRSPSPPRRYVELDRRPVYDRGRSRSRSPARRERVHTYPRSDESDERSRSRERKRRRSYSRSRTPPRRDDRSRGPYQKRSRASPPPPPRRSPPPPRRPSSPPRTNDASSAGSSSTAKQAAEEARAARLAAMQSNATSMSSERKERLSAMLVQERAELEREEAARAKSKGMAGFLSKEQKKVFSGEGGLGERIRRGRVGLVGEGA